MAHQDVILWDPDVARDGHDWEHFRTDQLDAMKQVAKNRFGFFRHISKFLSDHWSKVVCDAGSQFKRFVVLEFLLAFGQVCNSDQAQEPYFVNTAARVDSNKKVGS